MEGHNPPKTLWDMVLLGQEKDKSTIQSRFVNEAGEFALDEFLATIDLQAYDALETDEQREQFLVGYDPLDLFMALQEADKEYTSARLEIYFLTDFLEKNDPKLLVGLRQRRATAMNMKRATIAVSAIGGMSTGATSQSYSARRSMKSTMSIFTTASGAKKGPTDYQVNFQTKAELAERSTLDVERRMREHEVKAMREIKDLRARVEEFKMRCSEIQETTNNFRMHFLRDEQDQQFLDTATEKQIERKLRKFVSVWIRNARALISTTRLRMAALHGQYQKLRTDFITRSDLAGTICAVDLDQLTIQRQQLTETLEKKRFNMQAIKGVTGITSLSMGEEKQQMMNIEERSKRINNKTLEVIKAIAKLEKESASMENELNQEREQLESLREKNLRYEAPSVEDYITKKYELGQLEKEEKVLKRKIQIWGMRLSKLMKAQADKAAQN